MSDIAPAPTGSSILTSGIPQDAPAAGNGGTPNGNGQPVDGIAAAVKAAQRPEYIPEKYWKVDKNEADYEGLAKGYTNLEKLLGTEKVPKPLSDDDEEGWQRWYAASGRPESLDAYEFARPDKMPDGLSYDDDLEKDFKATAHNAGLNKQQANKLYNKYVKHQIDRYGAYQVSQQQSRAQVEADLRREYGTKYDGALTQAKVAMQTYADPEFRQYLDQTGMGNDPRMIRAFIKIGQQMTGDTRVVGTVAPKMDTADMERTIREFDSKHTKALFDRSHPEHKLRVKERNQLYEAAYGDQA